MPQFLLAIAIFASIVIYTIVSDIATTFGAAKKETFYLLAWGLVALGLVLVAAWNRIASLRTGMFAFAASMVPAIQPFLSSIANYGMSPDDPKIWHFNSPWYTSWLLWTVVALSCAAVAAWSWQQDSRWR